MRSGALGYSGADELETQARCTRLRMTEESSESQLTVCLASPYPPRLPLNCCAVYHHLELRQQWMLPEVNSKQVWKMKRSLENDGNYSSI